MRHALLVLILLLAPLAAHAEFLDCIFFDGLENQGTTDAAALATLQVHNCARKTVLPAASPPLQSLTWSTTVANQAAVLATSCSYGHGDLGGYGQNIAAGAGSEVPTMPSASTEWADEFPNYNYANNTCATNEVCGHYTQEVWRSTTQIGCAIQACTTGSPFGASFPDWTYVVCDYSPAGNDGDRPY